MLHYARLVTFVTLFAFVIILVGLTPTGTSRADVPSTPLGERWLDADLTTLTLTAYNGNTPVYSAPMSAGKPGYETPLGVFNITYRVYNDTMDSQTLGVPRSAPDGYYVRNVLYTQYISAGGGLAIHSNYWTDDSVFGHYNSSHGCLAMRTSDAKFFWEFASVGTPVVIHQAPTSQDSLPKNSRVLMPDVMGLPAAEAERLLEKVGLQTTYLNYRMQDITQEQRAFYAGLQPDCVFSSVPRAGESLPEGGVVRLAVR